MKTYKLNNNNDDDYDGKKVRKKRSVHTVSDPLDTRIFVSSITKTLDPNIWYSWKSAGLMTWLKEKDLLLLARVYKYAWPALLAKLLCPGAPTKRLFPSKNTDAPVSCIYD